MAMETCITMYFRRSTIHIRKKTLSDIGYPEYIHLLINEKEKQMFIQQCERDRDAFRINYVLNRDGINKRFYISDKPFLQYLALLIGIPKDSESLFFAGTLLEDGKTVFVDLTKHQIIPYVNGEI